jgi:DNA modification methylase
LPDLPARSADLVFSSPPYHDWERYSDEPTQSYRRYATYEAWVSGFLEPVIAHSRRVLRPRGHLVLNVSAGARKPTSSTVVGIAAGIGFRLQKCLPMLLARVPYLHPASGPYKGEYMMVFIKR